MCFIANPTPVFYTKCKHTVNRPLTATPVHQYLGTSQWHPPPLQPSSAASSTNRINKCPPCLAREKDGKDGKGSKDTDKDKDKDKGGKQKTVPGSSQRSVKVN